MLSFSAARSRPQGSELDPDVIHTHLVRVDDNPVDGAAVHGGQSEIAVLD